MRKKHIVLLIYKNHIYTACLLSLFLIAILLIVQFMSNGKKADQYYVNKATNNYTSPVTPIYQKPKLAIIIDDFGQNQNGVKEMMEIDRPLTFAIMPFLDYSAQDANEAHNRGYEVIVHLPMQSEKIDNPNWLGPRPIKICQDENEIRRIVLDSIGNIPHAIGINIHMGALTSENERVISCVMKVVKEKNLYFVDSVTSQKTICKPVAKKIGVKFIERNFFIENSSKNKNKEYIKKQLASAGNMAIEKGHAVAIGHVGSAGGKVTAEAIREMIPGLESKGIEFVFISELLK